jgi:hypothetical protein
MTEIEHTAAILDYLTSLYPTAESITVKDPNDSTTWRVHMPSTSTQSDAVIAQTVAAIQPASIQPRRELEKHVIIERLYAANKFDAVLSILKSDPYLYELWQAYGHVNIDDKNIISILTAAGADVASILAPVRQGTL